MPRSRTQFNVQSELLLKSNNFRSKYGGVNSIRKNLEKSIMAAVRQTGVLSFKVRYFPQSGKLSGAEKLQKTYQKCYPDDNMLDITLVLLVLTTLRITTGIVQLKDSLFVQGPKKMFVHNS